MEVTILEGFHERSEGLTKKRSKKGSQQMKLGTAAKQCKGKKAKAFRKCVASKLRKGRKSRRR